MSESAAELKWLHNAGYRIWYDEGINPGNEWPEEIARALDQARVYLIFISKNAIDSRNVRNEIAYALDECKRDDRKLFIAIHLEEVEISGGSRLGLGTIQAILKWRMSEERFAKKLTGSLPDALKYGETVLTEQPLRTVPPPWWLIGLVMVVIVILSGGIYYWSGTPGLSSQPNLEPPKPPVVRDIIPETN